MKQQVTITITGAAGHIGYALLFRLAAGQVFGPDTAIHLRLLELPQQLKLLEGVAMELEDCAFPLLKTIMITEDTNEAMYGANWAILVGAVPRKEGMERADLLKINGHIFATQGRALNESAAADVRVLVVGNPCNTNCLITMHHAPNIPSERFYAMTLLDELRARAQLAKKAQVEVSAVTQLAIFGNHSATQFPDFEHAYIHNQPVYSVIKDRDWLQNDFIQIVQQRGAKVIKARGTSSAASAANAALMTIYHLTHDTPIGHTFSVARCCQGEYGIEKGLIFSMPCRINQQRLSVVTDRTWDPQFGQQKMRQTEDELHSEYQTVKALGLIK